MGKYFTHYTTLNNAGEKVNFPVYDKFAHADIKVLSAAFDGLSATSSDESMQVDVIPTEDSKYFDFTNVDSWKHWSKQNNSSAFDDKSVYVGVNTSADNQSFGLGYNSYANENSFVMGSNTSGENSSVVAGSNASAYDTSLAMGSNLLANDNSVSMSVAPTTEYKSMDMYGYTDDVGNFIPLSTSVEYYNYPTAEDAPSGYNAYIDDSGKFRVLKVSGIQFVHKENTDDADCYYEYPYNGSTMPSYVTIRGYDTLRNVKTITTTDVMQVVFDTKTGIYTKGGEFVEDSSGTEYSIITFDGVTSYIPYDSTPTWLWKYDTYYYDSNESKVLIQSFNSEEDLTNWITDNDRVVSGTYIITDNLISDTYAKPIKGYKVYGEIVDGKFVGNIDNVGSSSKYVSLDEVKYDYYDVKKSGKGDSPILSYSSNQSVAVGQETSANNGSISMNIGFVQADGEFGQDVGDELTASGKAYDAETKTYTEKTYTANDSYKITGNYTYGNFNKANNSSMSIGAENDTETSSYAIGKGNIAKNQSVAIGQLNVISDNSFALGKYNTLNENTFAVGEYNQSSLVSGGMFIFGENNKVANQVKFTKGENNSLIIGYQNYSRGHNSFMFGQYNNVLTPDEDIDNISNDGYCLTLGYGNTAYRNYDMAIGFQSVANGGENISISQSKSYGCRNFALFNSYTSGNMNIVALDSTLTFGYNNILLNKSSLVYGHSNFLHSTIISNFADDYTFSDNVMFDNPNINMISVSNKNAINHNIIVNSYLHTYGDMKGNIILANQYYNSKFVMNESFNRNVLICNDDGMVFGGSTYNNFIFDLKHANYANSIGSLCGSHNVLIGCQSSDISTSATFDNNWLLFSKVSNNVEYGTVARNLAVDESSIVIKKRSNITNNTLLNRATIESNGYSCDSNFVFGGKVVDGDGNFVFDQNGTASTSYDTCVKNCYQCIAFNQAKMSNANQSFCLGEDNNVQGTGSGDSCFDAVYGNQNSMITSNHSMIKGENNGIYGSYESTIFGVGNVIYGSNQGLIIGRYNSIGTYTTSKPNTYNIYSFNSCTTSNTSAIPSNDAVGQYTCKGSMYASTNTIIAKKGVSNSNDYYGEPTIKYIYSDTTTNEYINSETHTMLQDKFNELVGNGSYCLYFYYVKTITICDYITSSEYTNLPSSLKSYYTASSGTIYGITYNYKREMSVNNTSSRKYYVYFVKGENGQPRAFVINTSYDAFGMSSYKMTYSQYNSATLSSNRIYWISNSGYIYNKIGMCLSGGLYVYNGNYWESRYISNTGRSNSILIGDNNHTATHHTFGFGSNNNAYNWSSGNGNDSHQLMFGQNNTVYGAQSVAIGAVINTNGHLSMGLGTYLYPQKYQMVIGKHSYTREGTERFLYKNTNGTITTNDVDSGFAFIVGTGYVDGYEDSYGNIYNKSGGSSYTDVPRNAFMTKANGRNFGCSFYAQTSANIGTESAPKTLVADSFIKIDKGGSSAEDTSISSPTILLDNSTGYPSLKMTHTANAPSAYMDIYALKFLNSDGYVKDYLDSNSGTLMVSNGSNAPSATVDPYRIKFYQSNGFANTYLDANSQTLLVSYGNNTPSAVIRPQEMSFYNNYNGVYTPFIKATTNNGAEVYMCNGSNTSSPSAYIGNGTFYINSGNGAPSAKIRQGEFYINYGSGAPSANLNGWSLTLGGGYNNYNAIYGTTSIKLGYSTDSLTIALNGGKNTADIIAQSYNTSTSSYESYSFRSHITNVENELDRKYYLSLSAQETSFSTDYTNWSVVKNVNMSTAMGGSPLLYKGKMYEIKTRLKFEFSNYATNTSYLSASYSLKPNNTSFEDLDDAEQFYVDTRVPVSYKEFTTIGYIELDDEFSNMPYMTYLTSNDSVSNMTITMTQKITKIK